MSKLLSTLLAAVFAAVTITPVAFAAEKKDEAKKEMKKGDGKKAEGKKADAKKEAKKEDKK
jgi:Ni/Co efflux regulator RcnB